MSIIISVLLTQTLWAKNLESKIKPESVTHGAVTYTITSEEIKNCARKQFYCTQQGKGKNCSDIAFYCGSETSVVAKSKNKKLWKTVVYRLLPALEQKQPSPEIKITNFVFSNSYLEITNDRNDHFKLDAKTGKILPDGVITVYGTSP